MNSSIEDKFDAGDKLRDSLSLMAKQALQGCVRLTQFEGYKDFLLTKEDVLKIDKRESLIMQFPFHKNEVQPTDFCKYRKDASIHDRLQILLDEINFDNNCSNPVCTHTCTETLFSVQMLTEQEMKRLMSKDEAFYRTFACYDYDFVENRMLESQYSAIYAICFYNYRYYDLKNIKPCTREAFIGGLNNIRKRRATKIFTVHCRR